MKFVQKFLTSEDATTAVEYAVMLALILIGCITAISAFGQGNGGVWGNIDSQLTSHGFGS